MQGVRRGEHLPARSVKEPVEGVRRGEASASTLGEKVGSGAGAMSAERRRVLLKIPRCDIDGVGEGR